MCDRDSESWLANQRWQPTAVGHCGMMRGTNRRG